MNTKTLLTIKTDKTIKLAAQQVAEELGIPLGTVINAFLRQFVRTKEVILTTSHRPSRRLIESIALAELELKEGKLHKARDVKDLMKQLRS